MSRIILAVLMLLSFQAHAFASSNDSEKVVVSRTLDFQQEREVSLEPDSRNIVKIFNIPEGATHVRAFIKNSKGSNVSLRKNKRLKKLKEDKLKLKIVTGAQASEHPVNLIFYEKSNRKMTVVGTESIQVSVEGDMICPAVTKPICGVRYKAQSCPFPDSKICFFAFEQEQVTFTSLCELEREGAEYLHEGSCNN